MKNEGKKVRWIVTWQNQEAYKNIHNYIQAYHDPCATTYYSVEAKPHNVLIWRNTNNNNLYNVKHTLITNNNLHSVVCNKFTQKTKTDINKNVSVFGLWVLWTTPRVWGTPDPVYNFMSFLIWWHHSKHKQKLSVLKQISAQIPTTPQEI